MRGVSVIGQFEAKMMLAYFRNVEAENIDDGGNLPYINIYIYKYCIITCFDRYSTCIFFFLFMLQYDKDMALRYLQSKSFDI